MAADDGGSPAVACRVLAPHCPALPCLIGNFAETSLKSVQVTRPRRARTGAGALSASQCPGVDLRCEATRCCPGTGSASSLRLRRAGGTASPATRSSYYSFPALIDPETCACKGRRQSASPSCPRAKSAGPPPFSPRCRCAEVACGLLSSSRLLQRFAHPQGRSHSS